MGVRGHVALDPARVRELAHARARVEQQLADDRAVRPGEEVEVERADVRLHAGSACTTSGSTPGDGRAGERAVEALPQLTLGGIRRTSSTSSTSKSGAPERRPNGAPRSQMCSPSPLPSTWSLSRYEWYAHQRGTSLVPEPRPRLVDLVERARRRVAQPVGGRVARGPGAASAGRIPNSSSSRAAGLSFDRARPGARAACARTTRAAPRGPHAAGCRPAGRATGRTPRRRPGRRAARRPRRPPPGGRPGRSTRPPGPPGTVPESRSCSSASRSAPCGRIAKRALGTSRALVVATIRSDSSAGGQSGKTVEYARTAAAGRVRPPSRARPRSRRRRSGSCPPARRRSASRDRPPQLGPQHLDELVPRRVDRAAPLGPPVAPPPPARPRPARAGARRRPARRPRASSGAPGGSEARSTARSRRRRAPDRWAASRAARAGGSRSAAGRLRSRASGRRGARTGRRPPPRSARPRPRRRA